MPPASTPASTSTPQSPGRGAATPADDEALDSDGTDLRAYEWFRPDIDSGDAAFTRLVGSAIGTFCVRRSSSGNLVVSYVQGDNNVLHVVLQRRVPAGGGAAHWTMDGVTTTYPTLRALIGAYASAYRTPLPRNAAVSSVPPTTSTAAVLAKPKGESEHCYNGVDLRECDYYFGALGSAEAAALLKNEPVGSFLIRISPKSPGSFVVSSVHRDLTVLHVLVERTEKGLRATGSAEVYASIFAFVDAFPKAYEHKFKRKGPGSWE